MGRVQKNFRERLAATRGGGAAVEYEEVPSAESLLNSKTGPIYTNPAIAECKEIFTENWLIDDRKRVTYTADWPRFGETNPRYRLFEKKGCLKKKLLEKKNFYAAVSNIGAPFVITSVCS
jgi:hypothetical protein